ncbi:ORF6N domain-containing protein [Pantoea dispersa]|uniref:ORF6N domain-containing protein n=1 Tax=Pantoea dispersa TaxID=59814 RepID=UPI00286308D1|nr:ORF6N domain-containing protein [Pantoea dispersa]MDR6297736.1 hypothetical protein [Pantoea dispersa]
MNTITIRNTQLPVVEYRSQRVVTFSMIDEAHSRADGTASRTYRENRDRFIEGEDFFRVSTDEIRRDKIYPLSDMARGTVTFLTESGYLMLAKSLTDDLAWQVQRQLVNSYFRQQQAPKTQNELIAAMALANVEQERRLNHVEQKVTQVHSLLDDISRGAIPSGWAGYKELKARSGMSDAKCRQLVKAYGIESKPIPFIAPGGEKSTMTIVKEDRFLRTFRKVMGEAQQRGTKWFHPNMGLFQVIGWGA